MAPDSDYFAERYVPAQTPIRKNDNVVVIAGKDRGKRGPRAEGAARPQPA